MSDTTPQTPARRPTTPDGHGHPGRGTGGRRRWPLLLAGVLVVVAGLTVRAVSSSDAAGVTGDALYAVLVTLVVAFLAPATSTRVVAAVALGACTAVELLQLTGVPATIVDLWWPARLVLGTTFGAVDLLAYAVGVGASALVLARTDPHRAAG